MQTGNVSGIILEGIAGTGKTSALTSLLKSKAWTDRSYLSSVVLTEHQTLRVLEPKRQAGSIQKIDNVTLLDSHVSYLECLQSQLQQTDWLARDRSAQKMPFIFERFHLSHLYHYDYLRWNDVRQIDERLAKLHAAIYLFVIKPEDIETRIIYDYQKAGWSDYLHTLGSTNQEITDYFIAKQEQLLRLAKLTNLPVVTIDSSILSTDEIVQRIIANWCLS